MAGGLEVAGADDALLKLGLARQRQGRHEQAITAYDRLIEKFADSPHRLQARFERGQALVALGQIDEARRRSSGCWLTVKIRDSPRLH